MHRDFGSDFQRLAMATQGPRCETMLFLRCQQGTHTDMKNTLGPNAICLHLEMLENMTYMTPQNRTITITN